MKVLVMVKATQQSEAGEMPSQELLTAMGKYNEELVEAGVMLSGEGLRPSTQGARVRFSGKERHVITGPFAETKELVAGFWLWRVKSMEDAIEWVKRCPNPMPVESEIEIRPVFEPDDFGEALTPELREQEARLRAQGFNLDGPTFHESPELLIAGLNETYTFQSRVNIPTQWTRFAPHMGTIPGQIGKIAYGVCWKFHPEQGFDYLSGVAVTDTKQLPAGFSHVLLPAHRYAVFAHKQHVSSIANTINTIWTKWLPQSGYTAVDSPSFERYTGDFDPRTGFGGMEIWVPINKQ